MQIIYNGKKEIFLRIRKMDQKNNDLIKGGLPLSSDDFVDKSKMKEDKLKILAAIGNINRLHSAQQQKVSDAEAKAVAETKVDETVRLDDYILAKDIQKDGSKPTSDEVIFQNDNVVSTDTPEAMNMEPDNYITPTVSENTAITEEPKQEEPVYVVDEKGKKGKKNKKAKKQYVRVSTDEEVKEGKGVAWLAYILFFIPLLIKRNNNFVRHHANEGFEVFLIDILGVALFVVGYVLKSENSWLTLALMVSLIAGVVLLVLTTITKIVLIIMSLAGKEARSPWFWNIRFIRPKKRA